MEGARHSARRPAALSLTAPLTPRCPARAGVSELTHEPWQFEVDGRGRMKCLACCAAPSGSCGAPGHDAPRRVQQRTQEEQYPRLPPPGVWVDPAELARFRPPPPTDGHWETRTERVWVPSARPPACTLQGAAPRGTPAGAGHGMQAAVSEAEAAELRWLAEQERRFQAEAPPPKQHYSTGGGGSTVSWGDDVYDASSVAPSSYFEAPPTPHYVPQGAGPQHRQQGVDYSAAPKQQAGRAGAWPAAHRSVA